MANTEELPHSSQSSSSQGKMNIYLKVTKTVALKVTRSNTIRNLKAAIREKEGLSETLQEIYYGGNRLKDDENLDDCGIQENSTLHLVLQTSGVVKLNIKISSSQKRIEFEAKSRDTVHNIKLMIQTKEGIDSDTYTLLYAGKLLENEYTLASIGIKDEATFNLVFNPRDVITLSIKRPIEGIVKTQVKLLYTIRDIKEIIESMFGFPFGDHNLVYNGQELEDSLTLASYKVSEDSILEILPRGFQIFVKIWSGKTIALDVRKQDTILCVKIKILKKIGNSENFLENYHLVYAGKCLEDTEDLARLGVEKQSTLYMKPRFSTTICYVKLSDIEGGWRLLPRTSIGNLKEIISKEVVKRPVKEVLLKGNALRDDCTLAFYALQEDTVLTIIL